MPGLPSCIGEEKGCLGYVYTVRCSLQHSWGKQKWLQVNVRGYRNDREGSKWFSRSLPNSMSSMDLATAWLWQPCLARQWGGITSRDAGCPPGLSPEALRRARNTWEAGMGTVVCVSCAHASPGAQMFFWSSIRASTCHQSHWRKAGLRKGFQPRHKLCEDSGKSEPETFQSEMQDLLRDDCFCPVTAAEAQTTSFTVDDDKKRKEKDGGGVRKKYWIKLRRKQASP